MPRTGFIDGQRIRGFTLRGSAARNGMNLTISDLTTPSSGYSRGLYINYTASGAKTGSAEVNALAIDLAQAVNLAGGTYSYGLAMYLSNSGNRNILGQLTALSIYIDAMGSGTLSGTVSALDIGIDATNAVTGHKFARFYVAAGTLAECFRYQGTATTFWNFVASNSCGLSASSTAGSVTHKIACKVGGADAYLHLFDS